MNNVMWRLEDNSFIKQQLRELEEMKKQVTALVKKLK
jgi:hypothetical protein